MCCPHGAHTCRWHWGRALPCTRPPQVFAVSSAATAFQLMGEVPPITLAAWRLQLTTLILAVGAAWQWRGMDPEARQRSVSSAGMLLASGLCLALHFGSWVWGLEHTSLTHSLLFVSCSPLLIALWAFITRQPISRMEVFGTVLGLLGASLLAFNAAAPPSNGLASPAGSPSGNNTGTAGGGHRLVLATLHQTSFSSGLPPAAAAGAGAGLFWTRRLAEQTSQGSNVDHSPHLSGDVASLVAAIAVVGYLQVGSSLRRFMPVFVYAAPVTGVAAAALTVAAAVVETSADADADVHGGVWGWPFNRRYAALVCYLAFVPGIVGHTGFNALLRYITPLTVALAFQLEPLVGSLIGWAVGVAGAPGWGTCLAGSLVLTATGIVIHASTQRQEQEAQAVEQAAHQGSGEGGGRAMSQELVDMGFVPDAGEGARDSETDALLLRKPEHGLP